MKTITAVKIIISVYLLTTMITTPTAIKTEQIPTEVPLTSPTERNNNGYHITLYSQTCNKRSPLGPRKSGFIRQVTSWKRFNSYKIFYDRTRKRWPFNTGDCIGRFDCIYIDNFKIFSISTCTPLYIEKILYTVKQNTVYYSNTTWNIRL